MREESFKVDAFHQRDDTGILGRMIDLLGNSMSTSKISIDSSSNNLVGDPFFGRATDVIGSRGPDKFYQKDDYNIKNTIFELNNATSETSSIHANLWSQSLIDSEDKSDNYLTLLQSVSNTNSFSANGLGSQFQMILRLIKLRKSC
jgi:hypothetical protein